MSPSARILETTPTTTPVTHRQVLVGWSDPLATKRRSKSDAPSSRIASARRCLALRRRAPGSGDERDATLGGVFPAFVRANGRPDTWGMLTVFGALAVTFMMLMYALERRNSAFILAFAGGCASQACMAFSRGRGHLVSSRSFGRWSLSSGTGRSSAKLVPSGACRAGIRARPRRRIVLWSRCRWCRCHAR